MDSEKKYQYSVETIYKFFEMVVSFLNPILLRVPVHDLLYSSSATEKLFN